MKLTIGEKEYAFIMKGTVGHLYRVQSALGDVAVDLNNPQHWMLFLYSILVSSNKDDAPSLDDFLDCLTGPILKELNNYVNDRWKELEPGAATSEKKEDGEKND